MTSCVVDLYTYMFIHFLQFIDLIAEIENKLLYTPYIVKFFANRDFKTFSRVVKFAIEESNVLRTQVAFMRRDRR